jgi:hypothetical protein
MTGPGGRRHSQAAGGPDGTVRQSRGAGGRRSQPGGRVVTPTERIAGMTPALSSRCDW